MPSSKGKPTNPKLREEVKEGMSHRNPIVMSFHCANMTIPQTSRMRRIKMVEERGSGQLGRYMRNLDASGSSLSQAFEVTWTDTSC